MARTIMVDANLRPTLEDKDVMRLMRDDGLDSITAIQRAIELRTENIQTAMLARVGRKKAICFSHRGREQEE